jgi:hypothetical protein
MMHLKIKNKKQMETMNSRMFVQRVMIIVIAQEEN